MEDLFSKLQIPKSNGRKFMFPETKSIDGDSSDSDSDVGKKNKFQRRPLRIPFLINESTTRRTMEESEEDSEEEESIRQNAHSGEDGLFVIDSTGGAGDMVMNEKEKKAKK